MTDARKTVLVVDDDAQLRTLVCRRIQDEYEPLEAGDPKTALALALQRRPDCILMDLGLPELSGIELCTILSDMNATKLIPVIVMTGQASVRVEEIAKVVHIAGFLQKPFDLRELKGCIEGALSARTAERRREWRVRLPIAIRIVGADEAGARIDCAIVTHDVSVSGFSCYTHQILPIGTCFDVLVGTQRMMRGQAVIVRVENLGTPEQRYGFHFIQRPENWVLR